MDLYINIDKANIPEWQIFFIGRLSQEYGKLGVVSKSTLQHSGFGLLKKIQIKIEDKFSPVNQNKVDYNNTLQQCTQEPQKGDIVIELTGTALKNTFKSGVRVWYPLFNGQHLSCLRSIGEYEIVHKCATFDIELCENGCVLETARYNPHFSAVRNWKTAAYSLHWLVLKCLRNNSTPKHAYQKNLFGIPEFSYSVSFYSAILQKYLSVFANRLWGYYREHWTIGISMGSYLKDGISDLKILPEPKNEFWADPFLYYHNQSGKTILFIERFPFKEKKGVISCAELDEKHNIHDMHDIIVRDYHFSFPHVIEENGEIYMMPESSANNQLEVYKCTLFPNKWKLHATALHGERVADSIYYKDKNGDSWIFTTYSDSSIDLHCTMMMIYKVNSLDLNSLIPHKKNPIIIDSTCARNGGHIYEENSKIYRVSQDNSHGMYGYGINVHEILKLSLDEYEEKLVCHTDNKTIFKGIGTHQMCQISNMFVMDIRNN